MNDIKKKMQTGDVQGAAEDLRTMLAAEPDNAEAQMLYGTCCHILGDDKTFGEIHDKLAPRMVSEKDEKMLSLWRKYERAVDWTKLSPLVLVNRHAEAGMVVMEYVIIGVLVLAAIAGCLVLFGPTLFRQYQAAEVTIDDCRHLYAGPTEEDRIIVERVEKTRNEKFSQMPWSGSGIE